MIQARGAQKKLGVFCFRKYNKGMKIIARIFKFIVFCAIIFCAACFFNRARENAVLKKVIERLSADSRIAEVIVTDVKRDPQKRKTYTTIKFQEYDSRSNPLPPKYFTFSSNIIQFQSLVIRFDDFYVKSAHPLKGKSAYIFLKAFVLKDKDTEVFELSRVNEVPAGYRTEEKVSAFEQGLWQEFWKYALQPRAAKRAGIKNAQIEAPGTKFVPGLLYTLKIEHDGGLRVDARALPSKSKKER
jgi:hypothetical protein